MAQELSILDTFTLKALLRLRLNEMTPIFSKILNSFTSKVGKFFEPVCREIILPIDVNTSQGIKRIWIEFLKPFSISKKKYIYFFFQQQTAGIDFHLKTFLDCAMQQFLKPGLTYTHPYIFYKLVTRSKVYWFI